MSPYRTMAAPPARTKWKMITLRLEVRFAALFAVAVAVFALVGK